MDPISFATGNTNPRTLSTEAFVDASAQMMRQLTGTPKTNAGKLVHQGLRDLMAKRERDRARGAVDPEHLLNSNVSMPDTTVREIDTGAQPLGRGLRLAEGSAE